jgi:hypothetical protein
MEPSVVGAPEVGPPPVTPLESLFSMESPGPLPPSYLPPELAQAWETNTATYPTSADYVTDPTQGALSYGGIMPRKWGSTWRFPS